MSILGKVGKQGAGLDISFMFLPNLHASFPPRKTTLGLGKETKYIVRKPNLYRNGFLRCCRFNLPDNLFPTYGFPYGTKKCISFKIASQLQSALSA